MILKKIRSRVTVGEKEFKRRNTFPASIIIIVSSILHTRWHLYLSIDECVSQDIRYAHYQQL